MPNRTGRGRERISKTTWRHTTTLWINTDGIRRTGNGSGGGNYRLTNGRRNREREERIKAEGEEAWNKFMGH